MAEKTTTHQQATHGRVDIVIPVYNEGDNIEEALMRIKTKLSVPYTVFIVYDRDDDNTLPVVERLREQHDLPVELLKNRYGRGALKAILTGLRFTKGEFVVVTMADLSDPPEVINEMLRVAKARSSDIVCGSRYMPGGKQVGGPWLKRTLSYLAGVSLRFVMSFPTHDVTNSFKLYKRRVIQNIQVESTGGFELGMELVVKSHRAGFRIDEVPTVWTDRSEGESRFKLWAWLPSYLRWYFYALASMFRANPTGRKLVNPR